MQIPQGHHPQLLSQGPSMRIQDPHAQSRHRLHAPCSSSGQSSNANRFTSHSDSSEGVSQIRRTRIPRVRPADPKLPGQREQQTLPNANDAEKTRVKEELLNFLSEFSQEAVQNLESQSKQRKSKAGQLSQEERTVQQMVRDHAGDFEDAQQDKKSFKKLREQFKRSPLHQQDQTQEDQHQEEPTPPSPPPFPTTPHGTATPPAENEFAEYVTTSKDTDLSYQREAEQAQQDQLDALAHTWASAQEPALDVAGAEHELRAKIEVEQQLGELQPATASSYRKALVEGVCRGWQGEYDWLSCRLTGTLVEMWQLLLFSLLQHGYCSGEVSGLKELMERVAYVKGTLRNYASERDHLIKKLAVRDIQLLVEKKPSIAMKEKSLNAFRRLQNRYLLGDTTQCSTQDIIRVIQAYEAVGEEYAPAAGVGACKRVLSLLILHSVLPNNLSELAEETKGHDVKTLSQEATSRREQASQLYFDWVLHGRNSTLRKQQAAIQKGWQTVRWEDEEESDLPPGGQRMLTFEDIDSLSQKPGDNSQIYKPPPRSLLLEATRTVSIDPQIVSSTSGQSVADKEEAAADLAQVAALSAALKRPNGLAPGLSLGQSMTVEGVGATAEAAKQRVAMETQRFKGREDDMMDIDLDEEVEVEVGESGGGQEVGEQGGRSKGFTWPKRV